MLTLSDLLIGSAEPLKSALRRMTDNHRGVLFVCNGDARLVGVLSDGDIRRTLLEETMLTAPVAKVMNPNPTIAETFAEAEALLRRHALVAVPVVTETGLIIGAAVEHGDQVLSLSFTEEAEPAATAKAIAVIPARGGSKRIPKKNLATVGGRSLLGWAIRAAKQAKSISQILVSTDDPEIAEESRRLGVPVPWLRPSYLSTDSAPTIGAIEHAMHWASEHMKPAPEFGVLLEPTAPLRRGDHIDRAVALLAESDADCVMSVSEVPHLFHPEELLRICSGEVRPYLGDRTMANRRMRGDQEQVYVANGLVYAFRVQPLLESVNLYGRKTIPLITPAEEFLDIDTEEDLSFADWRMAHSRG